MSGALYKYLSEDHERLDGLLNRALSDAGKIDIGVYAEFRAGLLRHISIEEKILMAAAQRHRGGTPLPIAAKNRLDHGALVSLMVPPPSASIIATIRAILIQHNDLEEKTEGLYETTEALAGAESTTILEMMHKAANIPVLPHNPDPKVLDATRRAVERAGHRML